MRPTMTRMPSMALILRAIAGIIARNYNTRFMKAVLIREHGGLERLEITPLPDPPLRPGFARVRVRAVALNHLDIWVRQGVPGHKFPLPIVPGSEVSGVIDEIEANELGWKAGDEVIVAPSFSCGQCVA